MPAQLVQPISDLVQLPEHGSADAVTDLLRVLSALLELPDELMAEVDVIHEKCRNPCMYYTTKEIWKNMPGLPPTASEPEPEREQ